MHKRRILTFAATIAAIAAIGAVPSSAATVKQGTAAAPVAKATACVYTKVAPADRYKGLPVFNAKKAAKPYVARLRTTQGEIDFTALTTKAPCTTWSFRFLATRHYYDGTHCHRLTTQRLYVLQCGDPTGTGSGGPGYKFPDENLTGATYPAGTVAMANAGPDTNGSQFFIVWKDTKLSPAYTPFGRVTAGMSVLKKIAAAGEDDQNGPGDGYPHLWVAFRHITIVPR
jgi:peptidyl-prolyl cis-trans isomerase B (cyclophilin B)